MILALIISWLAASQMQEAPADVFVGAWGQGPFHVMTEEEIRQFDSCDCPMLIYRLSDDRIRVDRRRRTDDYIVSRHGDDWLWTLVDNPTSHNGQQRLVRMSSEDLMLRAYLPGLETDWSRSVGSDRCPAPPDLDLSVPPTSRRPTCG